VNCKVSPNSQGLNPVDYEVWRVFQRRLYHTRTRDVGK